MSNYVYVILGPRGIKYLEVNGKVVHSIPADFEYFKKWCPNVSGKKVFMIGLGFGVDCEELLRRGATSVTVAEIIPEVIKLYNNIDSRIIILNIDGFNYNYEEFDIVIDSTSDYREGVE